MRGLLLVLTGVLLAFSFTPPGGEEEELEGKAKKSRAGVVDPSVVEASVEQGAVVAAPDASGFSPQTRLGFTVGDQWEPALAADRFGHVYILYPQYGGVPGCAECGSPTMIFQSSADGGTTWGAPRLIGLAGPAGWDAQLAVDRVDGRTLYAAWMENNKSDIVVARSDDDGASFSPVIADETNAGTDKPILAVRGDDVYVGYNHAQKVYVSASHDGGATFTQTAINTNGKLGWSLAGGATVDPAGRVFFSWAGYEQNGGARGAVNLYVSRSADRGKTWATKLIETSAAPPDCSDMLCGWAFLGAQITMTSDAQGTLYALWNSGAVDRGPERIYFSSSRDGGVTWQPRRDVSLAPAGVAHAFPAIAAGAAGDVRIAWMDARETPWWNVYLRRSSDGGATWTGESDVSSYVSGYEYIQPAGFSFPFGDYFEMDIDGGGATHLVWGEGLNYDSPGSIWYSRSR